MNNLNIIELIEKYIKEEMIIPRPYAKLDFKVKGFGIRRGKRALIYFVPNSKNLKKPNEKGISLIEFQKAYNQLNKYNELTFKWFEQNLPECNKEGSCNFTTIGGIFKLLNLAVYKGKGIYKKF